jgi:hypothetical protein
LRDGTTLEVFQAHVCTNHTAICGNGSQRTLHRIFGTKLPLRYVGYEITAPAEEVEGALGIFVLHRNEAGEHNFASAHNLRIKQVRDDGSEEPFYVTTAYGGYGIWQGAAPKGEKAQFVIQNGRDEKVARFEVTKRLDGEWTVRALAGR